MLESKLTYSKLAALITAHASVHAEFTVSMYTYLYTVGTFQQKLPELRAGCHRLRLTVLGRLFVWLNHKYSVFGQTVGHRVNVGEETGWRKGRRREREQS